ncbi:MAG: PadR family transcriptional regulator [Candidatus Acidiferrales bacterium]
MCVAYAYSSGRGSEWEGRWVKRGVGSWPGFFGYRAEGGRWGVGVKHGRSWSGRFFEPGEVRLALLSLLAESPKHGYQLMKDLEERSGGLYHASAGTIYPTLQQLEDEDLVRAAEEDGKRVYRITEAGKEELEKNKEAVARIWARAKNCREWAPWLGPESAAVAIHAAQVTKAALRAATRGGGEPDRIKRIREILDKVREELDSLGK